MSRTQAEFTYGQKMVNITDMSILSGQVPVSLADTIKIQVAEVIDMVHNQYLAQQTTTGTSSEKALMHQRAIDTLVAGCEKAVSSVEFAY